MNKKKKMSNHDKEKEKVNSIQGQAKEERISEAERKPGVKYGKEKEKKNGNKKRKKLKEKDKKKPHSKLFLQV